MRVVAACLCLALLLGLVRGSRNAQEPSFSWHDVTDGVSSSRYTDEAEADRVISLPGWGEIDTKKFSLFSGVTLAFFLIFTQYTV